MNESNQRVFFIDEGNPNGYIQAQKPAICYSGKGGIWTKTNDTFDNKGWICNLEDQETAPE